MGETQGTLILGNSVPLQVERIEIGRGCLYVIYQLQEIPGVLKVLYNTNSDIV